MDFDKEYKYFKLAKGSYGTVLQILNTNYVLKLMEYNDIQIIELDIMNRLKHQNIMNVVDFGNFEITGFNTIRKIKSKNRNSLFGILMERAITDLHKLLNYYNDKNIIINIIDQIKNGILFLHENNIINGDLKPDNILIFGDRDNPILKLTDFGLSKYMRTDKVDYSLVITPGYRPPEVYEGRDLDKKIDYWSLGMIIYQLITKIDTYIHDGKNAYDIFLYQSQEQIDNYIDKALKDYPEDLISFTKTCLTKDPKYRNLPLNFGLNNVIKGEILSIKNNIRISNDELKEVINKLLKENEKLGWDGILKILQYYINIYSGYPEEYKYCYNIILLYLFNYDFRILNNTNLNQYIDIIQRSKGIINFKSLYDTNFRNIYDIQTLEEYEKLLE